MTFSLTSYTMTLSLINNTKRKPFLTKAKNERIICSNYIEILTMTEINIWIDFRDSVAGANRSMKYI